MPFGLGEYVESALKPHLIYARRQGITLAVAALFGVTTLFFVVLSLFLALTYVMAPLLAALLCAALCAVVAGTALAVARRRARRRGRPGDAAAVVEETIETEKTATRVRALTALASAVIPVVAIGAVTFYLGRRKG